MTYAYWSQDRGGTVCDPQVATDRDERWAVLAVYEGLTAAVFEEAGVPALLVGDTAGMVVPSYDDTVPVTQQRLLPLVQAGRLPVCEEVGCGAEIVLSDCGGGSA